MKEFQNRLTVDKVIAKIRHHVFWDTVYMELAKESDKSRWEPVITYCIKSQSAGTGVSVGMYLDDVQRAETTVVAVIGSVAGL